MRAALAGDAGQKPGLGRKPDVRRLFFFFLGGETFFRVSRSAIGRVRARRERKIDRLRRSALRADPETRSRFVAFLGLRKKRRARVAREARAAARPGERAHERSRSREGDAGERIGSRTHRGHVQNARASRLLDSCASPTATLVLVTEKPSGRACLAGRRNVGRVCQRRKEIARSNRVGSGPRRVERGSFRGFERARTCLAEPIRYRDLVAGKPSRARARTSRPNLAWRVASAFRFAAHFLVAEPSVGKTERRGGEKVGQTSGRATEPTVCGPSRRAEGEFLAESRRAGTRRSRAAGVSATTSPNPSRAAPRTTRGGAFRGKPARASVKNSPSPRVSGRRERAHRGGCGRGKPREARLRSAHECEAPTRPTRRAKTPPRAALARLRRERERAAMAKPERREYCRTRAHLRKTAFQSRRVVPYPETTSLTPARPLRASISPSSARATDPRPCHRRR